MCQAPQAKEVRSEEHRLGHVDRIPRSTDRNRSPMRSRSENSHTQDPPARCTKSIAGSRGPTDVTPTPTPNQTHTATREGRHPLLAEAAQSLEREPLSKPLAPRPIESVQHQAAGQDQFDPSIGVRQTEHGKVTRFRSAGGPID